jgi:hypothetical protein
MSAPARAAHLRVRKGVMVSHGNLMAASACLQLAMKIDEQSRIQIDLPLFQDMGLIGSLP